MSDQVDQNTGLLLFYPYRAMEDRVLAHVREAGYEVTAAQGRIFARIGPSGTRLSDLAAQAQVTKATAGFIVDQLERSGLVTRVPDPDDRRARLVTITDKGHNAVRLAAEEVAQSRRNGPRTSAHAGCSSFARPSHYPQVKFREPSCRGSTLRWAPLLAAIRRTLGPVEDEVIRGPLALEVPSPDPHVKILAELDPVYLRNSVPDGHAASYRRLSASACRVCSARSGSSASASQGRKSPNGWPA